MNLDEIKELIEIFDQSSLSKLEIAREKATITMEKASAGVITTPLPAPTAIANPVDMVAPASSAAAPAAYGDEITSPMVGTFYRSPSPSSAPFINIGDSVKKGQVIGIIEAMKIMNEIEAEFDCKILQILQEDGQPIEYGTPLFLVEKI